MDARTRRFAGLGLVAFLVLFGPGVARLTLLSLREFRQHRQLAALQARQERLTTQRERLQTDKVYVEGLIRSTFRVAQPGERVLLTEPAQQGNSSR